jgi:hypothetical protein
VERRKEEEEEEEEEEVKHELHDNWVLRRTFGPNRRKRRENGEDSKMRSFITCTLHQILLGRSNQG